MKWFVFISLMILLAPSAFAQRFTLLVEHEHALRNCSGTLVVTPEKMQYKTDDKRDAREWEYREIRQLTIVSSVALELATYEDQKRMVGRDRVFKFKLTMGRITPELSAFFAAKVTHPLVTAIPPQLTGTPLFTIPVKHQHAVGGCAGTLRIYDDRIVFDAPTDARFWRYRDIQNVSHSERFRFEIVGYEDKLGGWKAYHFQLKEDLPAQAYDYVWARVYPTRFQR
ncbi:MAG TPA: hypothetical protein VFZ34_24680 [Blastocatellia bacterium]|nr:hypothetical protein [Blastocatellia bacterium]